MLLLSLLLLGFPIAHLFGDSPGLLCFLFRELPQAGKFFKRMRCFGENTAAPAAAGFAYPHMEMDLSTRTAALHFQGAATATAPAAVAPIR